MKLLLTGAGGQLGQALLAAVPAGWTVQALPRAECDIGDAAAVQAAMARHAPQAVVNAAAYTAVDRAESEPEAAYRCNAAGPAHLARACRDAGVRLVHISTDFVFDGRQSTPYAPQDPVAPLGVYGQSKWEGEQAVRAQAGDAATILRTAWVYGPSGHNFVRTMLRLLGEREELGVVSDQIGSPTSTASLAQAIYALLAGDAGRGETLHWTDAGVASWYDFAHAIREYAREARPAQRWAALRPNRTAEYPTPARRPAYSVLDCTLPVAVPRAHWREALHPVVAALLRTGP